MAAPDSYDEPDEHRPAKRARLEPSLKITEELHDEVEDDDDWDDIYSNGLNSAENAATPAANGTSTTVVPSTNDSANGVNEMAEFAVESASLAAPESDEIAELPISGLEQRTNDENSTRVQQEVEDGVPSGAIDLGVEFVDEQEPAISTDQASARMLQQTTQVESDVPIGGTRDDHSKPDMSRGADTSLQAMAPAGTSSQDDGSANAAHIALKPREDAAFLSAAVAQKGDAAAEWQFDSSDAESSSDSDSDSDSEESSEESDSGSEGGYEMLDAATAAKILMSGDGDDDEGDKGKGKSGADHQPRTANEVKDEIVKPDVVVTEDMKITYLGAVERIVEGSVLVKGVTPGEYQVLESGSVLCKENREVIGAVAEPLGRVQEPLYSIAFNNDKEIEEAGLEPGTKLFYVDEHSTFVFTQPLKNMKWTDASNIHDEEVGEDELEFSDDEAEAEYKRQKKLAKRGGRAGLSRGEFNAERATRTFGAPGHDSGYTMVGSTSDAPQQAYGSGMSYDDDGDVQEEFYSPLKRPDNLSQLMAGAPSSRGDFGRGRGRGWVDRGRGRGSDRGRGRGRGGSDARPQRGGRGGYGKEPTRGRDGGHSNGHRGNAHSFPDRHNDDRPADRQSQPSLPRQFVGQRPSPPVVQTQHYAQYNPPQQSPSTYQFNGYTFQYGNPPPAPPQATSYYQDSRAPPPPPPQQQQHSQPQVPQIPPGAFVNPAFFQGRQVPVQAPWPAQQQYVQGVAGYANADASQHQQAQSNLADILRQLGGQR